jgi:RNA polymerase sigma-70 factor (ECF subfamily)
MAGHDIPDEALMRQFQEAFDEVAFDELVARYYRPAQVTARNLLGQSSAAEDAVQEAFVRVVGARKSFDPARSFAPWFYSILRHVCVDLQRKEGRRSKQLEALAEQARDEAQAPPSDGRAAAMLQSLPPPDQEVLALRLVHGMPFHEIAAHLGCSVETAKKRAQRALKRLRADDSLRG